MPLIEISSIDDPRVADYVGVREAELRKDRYDAPGGLFVAEGELVVRRLLRSRYRTRSVLATHARLRTIGDALAILPADVPVYVVDQRTMNAVVGFNIHRGLLAIGERGPEPDIDRLITEAGTVVVLEDLVNHDNLGGIFRNVAALAGLGAGGGAVLLSPKCADPLYRKAIRVSIGWALPVPFARLADWPGDLGRLKQGGFRVFALHPQDSARNIEESAIELRRSATKVALIVGTEGQGLSRDAIDSADECIQIPMPGRARPTATDGVDSLNASVAVAIALHRLAHAR